MASRAGGKLHGRWNPYTARVSAKSLEGDFVAIASEAA